MQSLARLLLRISGWTVVGDIPPVKKAVVIAAPHTSNWDGYWLIVCKFALGIRVRFFAKHSLFWWPLGPLLRAMGAIPVERGKRGAHVEKLVRLFDKSDELYLALAPEGTRRWRPHWRSGFHRIATAAHVPIVLAFIDYRRKRAGIGPLIPADTPLADAMTQIEAFYADCVAAIPANKGPVALASDEP